MYVHVAYHSIGKCITTFRNRHALNNLQNKTKVPPNQQQADSFGGTELHVSD